MKDRIKSNPALFLFGAFIILIAILVPIFGEDTSTQEDTEVSNEYEVEEDSVDLNSIIDAAKQAEEDSSVEKNETSTQEEIHKTESQNEETQQEPVTEEKDTSLSKDTTSYNTLNYYVSMLNKSKTLYDIEEAISYLSNKGISIVPLLDDESSGYLEFLTIHNSSDVQEIISSVNGQRLNPSEYELDGNVTDIFSILPGETISDMYDIDEIVIAVYDTQDGYNSLRVNVSYRPF